MVSQISLSLSTYSRSLHIYTYTYMEHHSSTAHLISTAQLGLSPWTITVKHGSIYLCSHMNSMWQQFICLDDDCRTCPADRLSESLLSEHILCKCIKEELWWIFILPVGHNGRMSSSDDSSSVKNTPLNISLHHWRPSFFLEALKL